MKKYVFIKQLDESDCGSACMVMLLKYMFNFNFTIGELRSIFNSDYNGCTYLGIKSGLNKIGIKSEVFKCENNIDVFEEVKYPFLTQISIENRKHFIVVYEKKGNKFIVGDPSKNELSNIKIGDFLKIWTPYILQVNKLHNIDNKLLYKYKGKKPNLYSELWTVKYLIIISWIISIGIYLLGIFSAGMYSLYFDMVIPNKLESIIIHFASLYLIALITQVVLKYINSKINIKINNKIDKSLITKLVSEVFSKDFSILEYYQSGELITRFGNISKIRSRMIYIFQNFPIDISIIIFTFFLLFKRSIPLSLLIFIPMIIFALLLYLSYNRIENLSYKLFEQNESLNVELIESIDNIETLKNYSVTGIAEEKIKFRLDELLKTSEKFFSFDMLQNNIKNTIISMFNILIFSLGAYLVITDNIASGTLLMFNTLAMNIFNPFLNITTLQSTLEQGKVAILRYEDLVNTKSIRGDGNSSIEEIEKIDITNLSFSYGGNRNILSNVNLNINKGENIAIIGNSGNGKSTLAKLLANYYDANEGDILVNGISYKNLNREKMCDKILYSPQSIQIFSDTILNNIILGRSIDLESVLEISTKIGFDNVINSLAEGFNTHIGSDGTTLSMGQLQLLNIIRSTVTNHEVIIFDEVTNGLDIILREKIRNYILNYGNIKIFITHDTELALCCDKIYVIKNGTISENLKEIIKSENELIELLK